jgi:hypothetical protein
MKSQVIIFIIIGLAGITKGYAQTDTARTKTLSEVQIMGYHFYIRNLNP